MLLRKILELFKPSWKPLAAIAFLMTGQRVGDLLVPVFAGHVIDAIAQHRPYAAITPLIAGCFLFWLFHGNMLLYLLGRAELIGLRYTAPRRIAVGVLGVLLNADFPRNGDTAMQQAIVERGLQALNEFMASLVRVAIPMTLPGLVTLALLLLWFPLLGIIAVVGGTLDMAATLLLNRTLAPLFGGLQALDYKRLRLQTRIFRELPILTADRDDGARKLTEYSKHYRDYETAGITAGSRYLGFSFGRGVVINITNVLTWMVGAWYVDAGVYTLGYFLASLAWSTYVLNMIAAATELQKQWLETLPAIRALLAELDHRPAAAPDATVVVLDTFRRATPEAAIGTR
jgi:ABC-type multidrug transport system fused ATPase/permease subunit